MAAEAGRPRRRVLLLGALVALLWLLAASTDNVFARHVGTAGQPSASTAAASAADSSGSGTALGGGSARAASGTEHAVEHTLHLLGACLLVLLSGAVAAWAVTAARRPPTGSRQ